MSNNERQRRFQEAHPGYDRRRKARQRSMDRNTVARLVFLQRMAAATAQAAQAPPALPTDSILQ